MEDFNRTLLAKIGWSLATNQDKAWVHMLNAKLVYCMVSTYFFNIYIYIYQYHKFFLIWYFFSFLICYFNQFNKSHPLYIKIYR